MVQSTWAPQCFEGKRYCRELGNSTPININGETILQQHTKMAVPSVEKIDATSQYHAKNG